MRISGVGFQFEFQLSGLVGFSADLGVEGFEGKHNTGL